MKECHECGLVSNTGQRQGEVGGLHDLPARDVDPQAQQLGQRLEVVSDGEERTELKIELGVLSNG